MTSEERRKAGMRLGRIIQAFFDEEGLEDLLREEPTPTHQTNLEILGVAIAYIACGMWDRNLAFLERKGASDG